MPTIPPFRVGTGYDSHRLAAGESLTLGGVALDAPFGTVAHSDGDALLHALCDALLGALALGDIGKHFPDTDPRYRGADSAQLLARVCEMVRGQGYEIGNADTTLCLQQPKIAPHIDAMRQAIAQAMGIDASQVAVKAKTGEKMGFVGRGEGVEAYATVLIYRNL